MRPFLEKGVVVTDQQKPPASLLSKSIPEPTLFELLRMVFFFFAIWLAVIALALSSLRAHGETIPSTSGLIVAPVAHPLPDLSRSLHVGDYARFAGIAAYRSLDWKTTTTGIRLGCKEVVLPKSIANNSGRLAAFEIGATAAQIGASTFLIHHGHRKLAETMDYVTIGAGMLVVSFNEHAIHSQEAFTSKLVKE